LKKFFRSIIRVFDWIAEGQKRQPICRS